MGVHSPTGTTLLNLDPHCGTGLNMPAKVNTPTTPTPTSQTPSQNLLQGNVVPQVRNKIKDLMKKFEREQFENVVDDQEKPAPLQKLLLKEEELEALNGL